ncbi:hypothetical protein ACFY1B_52355 [Streptomyces mirabilis]|uniref:RICIN domain-containing protein n=1 Tax=Streptomyces mirabilis TaxID=68239 RepID=UPI0034020939
MIRDRKTARVMATAIAAMTVSALAMFTAAPASATSEVHWVQNVNTGRCIDDSADFGLRSYPCNLPSFNNGYQSFTFWYDNSAPSPTVQIQNANTGDCIDDNTNASGQDVLRHWPCSGASFSNGNQKWWISWYWGNPVLKNAATLRCLDDSNDFGLRGYDCNAPSIQNGYQRWQYLN